MPTNVSTRAAAIALLLLALAACASPGGPAPGNSGGRLDIPSLDVAAPQQTETATFALG